MFNSLISTKRKQTIFAAFIYLVPLAFYARKVIGQCSDRVIGWPGDNLGLTWLFNASPATPWWQYSNITNFPNGEALWQPVYIIGQGLYVPYWLLAKLLGPLCGYTALISIGLLFSAVTMFLFISYLTKYRYFVVALFAGFALISFPYVQIKITNHFAYAFTGLLIILFWLLMKVMAGGSRKNVIVAGLLLGGFFYFDPYFILLGGVIYGSVLISVIWDKWADRGGLFRSTMFKNLLLVPLTAIVVASPVIYVRFAYSNSIESLVGSSRGSIVDDSYAFSARPWEYVLPTVNNPLSPEKLKNVQRAHYHGSNLVENPLYVGWVILSLAALTVIWFFRRKMPTKELIIPEKKVVLFAMTLVLMAGVLSLPPLIKIFGLTIYLPSYAVIAITNVWRVFARLVIDVQLGLIILASLGLIIILKSKLSKNKKRIILFSAFALCSIEFLTVLPAYDFKTAPQIYTQVKNDPTITAIAEYPLVDPPQDVFFTIYATYQQIHMKPMINTSLPNSETKKFRQSIMNLYAWQTVPVLCGINVDAVIVHDQQMPSQIPGAVLEGGGVDGVTGGKAWLYRLKCESSLATALVISDGFDGPSKVSYKDVEYFMHTKGVLLLQKLPNTYTRELSKTVKIEFYTFEKQVRGVTVKQGEKVVWSGNSTGDMNKQIMEFSVDSDEPIVIIPDNPPKDFSLVVSNMIVQ